MNKIENLKETVSQILTHNPETRDNDRLLILKIWAFENPRLRDDKNYSFYQWAMMFKDGDYTDPESIRRTRQFIQANNSHLRGEKYRSRRVHAGDMREALRY